MVIITRRPLATEQICIYVRVSVSKVLFGLMTLGDANKKNGKIDRTSGPVRVIVDTVEQYQVTS